ncbi:hypothetical protein BN873_980014 [Candidatus Competibacter denitrificans Run_A_D11]|uniref:Uncharacterized protein n=1 Tax=Candidatus Competibacter denitrificans Run_A_D11 TaxID=1400863 RepID=W6MED3_9GAMM|nr:hypothetical protein [Candidatus Competibacter denitrificans]CDI04413.1 hypothetical protein BN873_980014 [Candidatus Competibacter denitrificans Run_A_D11]HAS85472.1 hypothetical protein [Candidatus Competibacteraceae bacterium]HRC70292.1 hypothetical protein [Candidatus Competibacter denitrificans]
MSGYKPSDIPVKTTFGAAQNNAAKTNIPPNLYQLLIMINGVRSVNDLLRLGIREVDIDSFDMLYQLKLIEAPKNATVQNLPPTHPSSTTSKKGLAEVRFAVLDILLDISEKDFGVRPWIEKIEQVDSLARLASEVDAFCASAFGRKYPNVHDALRRAAAG